MDMIGGVKVDANILGVSYLDVFPMTTYKEAENIVEDLIAGGSEPSGNKLPGLV